jgi:putative ABC transport system permease protein
MSLFAIAMRNMGRNRFRMLGTVLAVAMALLTFLLLRTVMGAWLSAAEHSVKDRIATRHKISFAMWLPRRYVDEVRGVDGVRAATWLNWFGGRVPGKESQFFANMATDPETLLAVYDEIVLPPEQKQRWLEDQRGAIVGSVIARQFGWKVGDAITLEGSIYPGQWQFNVSGIYTASRRSTDQSTLYFHWKYLNEQIAANERDYAGWIVSRVASADAAAAVGKRIDALFDARAFQTRSMSERALQTSFLGMASAMLGAMQTVSILVLLIMALILGNTIAMGVRERTQEYGALRAIGFLPRHLSTLVLAEAGALGLAGGLTGVALAYPLINLLIGRFMEQNFTTFFPYVRLSALDAAAGAALSMVLAVGASALSARQVGKLEVVDALRSLE